MAVETSELCFMLNGKLVVVDNPDPQQLLVHYLRQSGHTGTKVKSSSFVIGSTKRLCLEILFSNKLPRSFGSSVSLTIFYRY